MFVSFSSLFIYTLPGGQNKCFLWAFHFEVVQNTQPLFPPIGCLVSLDTVFLVIVISGDHRVTTTTAGESHEVSKFRCKEQRCSPTMFSLLLSATYYHMTPVCLRFSRHALTLMRQPRFRVKSVT